MALQFTTTCLVTTKIKATLFPRMFGTMEFSVFPLNAGPYALNFVGRKDFHHHKCEALIMDVD